MKRRAFLINTTLATAGGLTILSFPSLGKNNAQTKVIQAGLVAPTILGITIKDGTLVRGCQKPYNAEATDEIKLPNSSYFPDNTPQLWRKGEFIGWLVDSRKVLTTQERIVGHLSGTKWLNNTESYTIQSSGDPAFKNGIHPAKVNRKSMPHRTINGVADRPEMKDAVVHHTVYLHFDQPLKQGAEYEISFVSDLPPLKLKISDLLESEAIHASQVGFCPDDEAKVAFLSCWLGTGGALTQPENVPFYVADDKGKVVFRGNGTITKRANDNESTEEAPRNLNQTDVLMLDFSTVKTPGEYRVLVPGVGSSYPILIAEGIWMKAFLQTMPYFYTQRSGLELKPPYTNFHRPRNIHPDDGVKVYHSTCTLMNSGNGLNAMGNDVGNFANLIAGKTDEIVPNAWGGYADSGDWDRRIQHLQATRLKLDLLLEGGETFSKLKLNIPESGNGLPDILNEALWNLDFYRRLMTPEGGVRGGVEAEEHPKTGEGSWQESWIHFAYAPDAWSSYLFASTAARCAHFAEGKYLEIAGIYREAAIKAMNWAEKELIRLPEDYVVNKMTPRASDAINKSRNLAAADLYRLTGDKRWHDLFLKTFADRNSESIWVYLRTNRDRDQVSREQCRIGLLESAQQILDEQQKVAFRWVRRKAGNENGAWGLFQRKDGSEILIRAWQLTGETKYRKGAILSTQMALGANPNNMVYTTGLGRNPMRNILYLDAEVQGKETPDGYPAFGPFNPHSQHKGFNNQMQRVAPFFVPEYHAWPQSEFCLDSGQVHPIDEHLPDLTGWVVYLYGALANK